MKKLLSLLALLSVPITVKAATSLQDQVVMSLTSHVTPVTEFTSHGDTKIAIYDSLFQFGHYQGNYILALDGGIVNSSVKQGAVAATWGAHAHLISLLRNYLVPGSTLLDYLDATPRWSYDQDVRKGVLSFSLGASWKFGGN